MRNYISCIVLPNKIKNFSIGKKAELVFEQWFKLNYQNERIIKQKASEDYLGIDYADERGNRYQVKGTSCKTYTFNCSVEKINDNLNAHFYIMIQIKDDIAYIESIYNKDEILSIIKPSINYNNSSFVWAKNLNQHILEL